MAPAHTRVVSSVSSAHPASAPLPRRSRAAPAPLPRCFRAPRLRLGSAPRSANAPPIQPRFSSTSLAHVPARPRRSRPRPAQVSLSPFASAVGEVPPLASMLFRSGRRGVREARRIGAGDRGRPSRHCSLQCEASSSFFNSSSQLTAILSLSSLSHHVAPGG
jgi:hypothetical protein